MTPTVIGVCKMDGCAKVPKPGWEFCRDCLNGIPPEVPEEKGELRDAAEALWRLGQSPKQIGAFVRVTKLGPRADELRAMAVAAEERLCFLLAADFWAELGAEDEAASARVIAEVIEARRVWLASPEPRKPFVWRSGKGKR